MNLAGTMRQDATVDAQGGTAPLEFQDGVGTSVANRLRYGAI